MREIHLTCPVCSAELTVGEGTEGPVGTCQACGTRIDVPMGAFAVLAARPGQTPALPADPPPPAEAPAPEVVEGDLVRWDEQAAAAPASAPQTAPPQVEAAPPPVAPAAEVPVPVASPELVGDEEAPAAVVFEIEDDEDREVDARSSTNLDLFEPQGGARGSVVSQYFRRSSYARKWMRARVLLMGGALVVLLAVVMYLLLTF